VRIAIGSAFRNAAGHQAAAYAHQAGQLALRLAPHHSVRCIAAAGDCEDATIQELARLLPAAGVGVQFVPCDHGRRRFGSTEEADRMEALTLVGNAILGGVRGDDDMLLYVESDLRWEAEAMHRLLTLAAFAGAVVAPMVWAGELFYDVWGFRDLDGGRFSPFPPYSSALAGAKEGDLVEVGSAGSCLAMPAAVARSVRMPPGGCLVGFCEEARRAGHTVSVAPWLGVAHPC
jgi:hypothetical protein